MGSGISFLVALFWISSTDTIASGTNTAAEYYFNRNDFPQAKTLLNELSRQEPRNVHAVLRLAEATALTEGRGPARAVLLDFLKRSQIWLSTKEISALIQSLHTLCSTFLNDESQSLFLQAQARARQSEWTEALRLIQLAAQKDRGNIPVLLLQADIEQGRLNWEGAFRSFQEAYETDPYWPGLKRPLLENYLYFREYEKVLTLFDGHSLAHSPPEEMLLYTAALVETGKGSLALPYLRKLSMNPQLTTRYPVITYYEAVTRPQEARQTEHLLKAFVTGAMDRKESWDPYRSGEKLELAKKQLQAMSGTSLIPEGK